MSKQLKNQAFKYTIINYVGILIGIISTIWIYPNDKEFLGKIRYVESIAQIIFPFILFGAGHALIQFYPTLTDKNKSRLLGYSTVSVFTIGFIMFICLLIFSKTDSILNYKYVLYALPLAFMLAYIDLYKKQAITLKKLATPTLFEKLIPKIGLPLIFVLLLAGLITDSIGLSLLILIYSILLLSLIWYVFTKVKSKIDFKYKEVFNQLSKNEYYKYCLFSFLGSFGAFFAFRIDTFIIPKFISFEANGSYSIALILAATLMIPASGLFAIYTPKISSLIKQNNLTDLRIEYKETAKLLLLVGGLLYSLMAIGITPIFKIFPTYNQLSDCITPTLILGLGVVVNMSSGFNSEIISYSNYYKFNVVTVLVLMVLNISLNLLFLTQTDLGILGVAVASVISLVIFNALKLIFIYKKFGFLPFDSKFFALLLIITLTLISLNFLNFIENIYLDLAVKVVLNIIVVMFLTYKLNAIKSYNEFVINLIKKLS